MLPHPLEAVIFDMDGLLLDTETLYRAAVFEACPTIGYEMNDALHLSLIGCPREAADEKLLAFYGDDFPLPAYYESAHAVFRRLCGPGAPPKPGARSLLDFLAAAGIPRGLATSTRRPAAEHHLKNAGLFDLLDVVVTRSDVSFGKPHPETFLKAASDLGVQPANCLALEDSHNGVRAAAAAGMATIMVPDMLRPTDEIRALCVAVMDDLGQVQVEIARGLALSAHAARDRQ